MTGWSVEEDSKLEAAIAEYGYCWSKVAACVPPRTDNQCRRRWKVLFPNEVPFLQAARKIQKAALISNFVDRESERPALGPNDFLLPETNLLTGSQNFVASQRKKRSRGSEVCERIEKDVSGNAATIFNATEIGLNEVPRLTNGSELENMHRRPVSRKGRSKRSYSTKQKTVPLSENCSSPCTDGMFNGEPIRESALHYNNPKRSSRLEGKRSGVESIDGFPRYAAICNGRVIERGSNDGEDFFPEEESPLLLTDSNFQRINVSTDASQSSRDSKLRPRRSVKPRDDVLETPSEAEMPVGDATLLKRQEETEDGKIGTNVADDNLSPFPDSMSLMEIINKIRTTEVGKARKKKRTENQETVSDGGCVAPAIGGESAPSTPWPADVNSSGISYPFMEEITPNLHSTGESNYLDVLREFDDYVMCSEMCDELQDAKFLSHHFTLVNFSKPCIVGNDNGGLAKGTKVGIRNEDHGVSSKF